MRSNAYFILAVTQSYTKSVTMTRKQTMCTHKKLIQYIDILTLS